MKQFFLVMALLLALPASVAGASGNEFPACTQERGGITACLGGTQCVCRWESGGTASGLPAGWRWDCSTLRPSCGDDFFDANDAGYDGQLPSTVGIDRSVESNTLNATSTNATTNTNTNTDN